MAEPTVRPIPKIAIEFIKERESCRFSTYHDSRGKLTIGYGHTGPDVHEGLTWTQAKCDAALGEDLATAAGRLARCAAAEAVHALTDNQYAALVSFVFNAGADPAWHIWEALNKGPISDVPAHLAQFDKAEINGELVEVGGLKARRDAEIALWNRTN